MPEQLVIHDRKSLQASYIELLTWNEYTIYFALTTRAAWYATRVKSVVILTNWWFTYISKPVVGIALIAGSLIAKYLACVYFVFLKIVSL